LTRGHLKKIQKNKIKNSKKPRSDTWHAPGLTRIHFKIKIQNSKKFKKIQKIKKFKKTTKCHVAVTVHGR